MRQVVLCADDFGLTEGVSRGILDLARLGRLSAASVMTSLAWWPRLAPALADVGARLGIGLHLNLTLGKPLGAMPRLAPRHRFPGLSGLLGSAVLGRLPLDEVRAEIDRQFTQFEAVLGRPPDFVDGHQHVHVLPGIRDELFKELDSRGWRGHLWIRDPSDRFSAIVRRRVAVRKALTVRALSSGLASRAREAGVRVNEGFSGFSAFDPARDPAADFTAFFEALGPCPVVMCHPGHVDAELAGLDPVGEPRAREYAYLASEAFLALLEERAIALVPRPASGFVITGTAR